MRKSIIILAIVSFIFQSCATLTSQTIIEPNKTFILGEGNHLGYTAEVKNTGSVEFEIFKRELEGEKIRVGILKVNQAETYEIPRNTMVYFQNQSKFKQVKVNIKLKGTSNLTMGYQDN